MSGDAYVGIDTETF